MYKNSILGLLYNLIFEASTKTRSGKISGDWPHQFWTNRIEIPFPMTPLVVLDDFAAILLTNQEDALI
jgi:hypothetical protein